MPQIPIYEVWEKFEMRTICKKCGRDLPGASSGAGRPRDYCTDGCRRATEYAIGRLNRRLENLETRESDLRVCGLFAMTPDTLEALGVEIARTRARLLDLLES
jgi:hypothetical protein